jgi:hypothetical protein
MNLTLVNFATKRGRLLLVKVKSTVSNHTMLMLREKTVDRYEFIRYDPVAMQEVSRISIQFS